MPKPLHRQTTVPPGGKIVAVDQDLAEGEIVDIFVDASSPNTFRSTWTPFGSSTASSALSLPAR